MRRLLIIIAILSLSFRTAFATLPPEEGMWLPMFVEQLNYDDMKRLGMKLTPEDIYSINNASIKDAIVGLSNGPTPSGFFCTGEVVSSQGLLFTNHHCGYESIQNHSTIEHDYLTDGFWAMSKEEELPNEGLSATFFIRMEDITDSIIPFLSDTMSSGDRSKTIREITGRLKKAASEDGKYHVVTKDFFGGSEFYLFVYVVYRDVRLVGAPPSAIGKFGGDTDNWMWPRHTGDFTIFRIYTAPDGSPADYSKDNVPLVPKYHLPISLDGVKKDDFAMIWGYPGGTDRYMTSAGIKFQLDYYNPVIIDLVGARLDVWKECMSADKKVDIMYASKYFGQSNGWKYSIGQSKGLKKNGVMEKKLRQEEEFMAWVNADPARVERYGNVLTDLQTGYEAMGPAFKPLVYSFYAKPEITDIAGEFSGLYDMLAEDTDESILKDAIDGMKGSVEDLYDEYSPATDRKLAAVLLAKYHTDIPVESQPEYLVRMAEKYKGDFEAYSDYLFENSIFADQARVMKWLDKPSAKTLAKDPVYQLAIALQSVMPSAMATFQTTQGKMAKSERLYIEGLRKMNPNKSFYPDANSTMRFTYGTVQDYKAADAVYYSYKTFLEGVMEKEDPKNPEFIVPERLKELWEKKDYGNYADENGRMVTCFLSTNDITGGNSGSPVINANGELIGIAFDGNWEAMSGDINFEPSVQRTINVDIRYVLFVIDKYAGAKNLIDELTIRPKTRKEDMGMQKVMEMEVK